MTRLFEKQSYEGQKEGGRTLQIQETSERGKNMAFGKCTAHRSPITGRGGWLKLIARDEGGRKIKIRERGKASKLSIKPMNTNQAKKRACV